MEIKRGGYISVVFFYIKVYNFAMDKAEELYKQGFTRHTQGNLEEAEKLYLEAVKLQPENLNTLFMLANLKYQQYRFPEAEKYLRKAMQISENVRFYDLLTRIKTEQKEYKTAIESAISGLKIEPENFELNFNIALAFKKHGDYELSLKFYQRAEKLRPDMFVIPYNMSNVYFLLGKPHESTLAMEKALALNPGNEELKYFLSISLFRERKYREGLELFESRLCKKTAALSQSRLFPASFASAKEWRGEDISDKTVFMFYEAGFGDVIQYARYFPLLKKRCKKLLFKPQEELVELFRENPLGIDEIITYEIDPVNLHFDTYVPMLSLPYLLGLDETNMFISSDGYMKPDPKKKEFYKQKFFNNNKTKIGIKWQGNTASETDRVIDAEAFIPLFSLPETQFYSFQMGAGAEEVEKLKKYSVIDLSKEFENFSDTAAALDNLDFVICNDTSLIHLAGAIGKKGYMLLPVDYNWRWHLDLKHNDWYSGIKMFKQVKEHDWTAPVKELYNELYKILS